MNDETTKQVAQELIAWIEGSREFVIEQAPLLAQDIVRAGWVGWGTWALLWFVLAGLINGIGHPLANRIREACGDCEGDIYTTTITQYVLSIIANAILALAALTCLVEVLEILAGPRLYVLQQLSRLL